MQNSILDSSSAILLYKADLFDKLINAYQVSLTRSVLQELTQKNRRGTKTFFHSAATDKIKVIPVTENRPWRSNNSCHAFKNLDRGEQDTIHCFMAGGHDFIITDDGRAARWCHDKNIPFINALLFPRLIYFADSISLDECRDKMETVIQLGRYSEEVISWAKKCQRENVNFAIPQKME